MQGLCKALRSSLEPLKRQVFCPLFESCTCGHSTGCSDAPALQAIFGRHGEVKEIRATPHKQHHKFVEFFDVRHAAAALRALNRTEIGGKRVKIEPSRPGGARRSVAS